MSQRQEAKAFFGEAAQDWQSKSVGRSGEYPLVAMRHRAVHRVVDEIKPKTFLDVGCGTGQLAIECAAKGMKSVGIDFAAEMIGQCVANRGAEANPEFYCSSEQDYSARAGSIDVISAQGFIEYISPDEMERFFHRAYEMLSPKGALVVGSRNRLFNVVSLNEFTRAEIALGEINQLIEQSIVFTESPLENLFDRLKLFEVRQKQPEQHPATGIGVSTRFQFSPADLIFRLRSAGFTPKAIYPVHYHGLPKSIRERLPAMHCSLALEIENMEPVDHHIIPYCTSYVLDVRRE